MAGLMDLFITIGVEDEASGKIQSITSDIGSGLVKAAKVGAKAVAAITAVTAAATTALIHGASQVAAYGDNIDKMSQKMGLSSQAYQEWDFILQHSGASMESMQRGMMTLTLAAQNGSEAFQALGLSQEQVASMSQDELFAATVSGLQGITDEGERAALAQKLLGGAAKELGPLLNMSAEETEEMRQRVHELGGVMGDEAVKNAAKFQDSLQDMKTVFGGLKSSLLAGFMPAMSTVMDGITALFSGNGEEGIAMITEGVEQLANQIQEVVPRLVEIASSVLEPVINAIAEQLPGLITTLLPVILSAIGKIVVVLVQNLPQILSAIWEALKQVGAELWPVLQEIFGNVGNWFREKFQAAKAAVVSVFKGWGDFFVGLWEDIKNAFSALGTKIGEAVSGAVSTGINKIIGFAEDAVNGAIGLINKAIDLINKLPGVNIGHIENVNFPRLAIGIDYVPNDEFPAVLHRGEAVLTAREAEEWRSGNSGSKSIENVFNFYGVSQADLDFICEYVNRELA